MLEASLLIMALVLTAIASSLAVMVWNKSRRDYRKAFALLMASQVLIMWSYTFDVFAENLEWKLFWNNFEYLGYMCAIVSFFLFAVQYSSNLHLNRPLIAILGIPSVLVVLAVATNPLHHLFYLRTTVSSDYFQSFNAIYGPLFYAYVAYAVAIIMTGLSYLVVSYFRASHTHRTRVGITGLACLIAIVSVVLNYPPLNIISGSIAFVLGCLTADLLLFLGAFSFELFSMVPFELERVMGLTRGGVFILDDEDTVMYQNQMAESLAQRKATLYQDKLMDVMPAFPREVLEGKKETSNPIEEIHELVPGRFFDVTVLPINDYSGRLIGKTVTLREITAQRRAEAEANAAKHTLDLMNSITRHDVLNQLTIIEGNLIMAQRKTADAAILKHIDASYQAALNIQKQMQFARDYQEMTKRTPVWQNVEEKIMEASTGLDLKGAHLSIDTKGVEILADLLLEKVLYNLMHNSIVHGGKVHNIAFLAKGDRECLQLIYTDDGAGISADMKPTLFSKGGGSNTGLGLFLSKEILGHSGMVISEDGRAGQGVRFVIRVPKGGYRNFHGEQTILVASSQPSVMSP
ncbi:MAG: histidine kinase N-terminal 7TM domain-containing protein [Methanomassiliicoccus sp.]|nr:histidine kinase N-terminal 7TM domain-containing protein [Methanomassiliicoccus sp.]